MFKEVCLTSIVSAEILNTKNIQDCFQDFKDFNKK